MNRRYALGREFGALDFGAEGEEARLAFQVLVGISYEDRDALADVDRLWLQARKAARHLGVEPPDRTDVATRAFFARHGAAYDVLRRGADRSLT